MATKTFDELKQLAIQIRDEKTNKQNTANRVGTAMLEGINKLEQDYYDKTAADKELKKRDDKLIELANNVGLYNVDKHVPLGGGFYTSATARAAVPSDVRKIGLIITYKTDATTSVTEQFIGSDVSGWTTDANWKNVGSEGGNKILEWKTDAATTRKKVPAKERKAGMQISYKPTDSDWVNEQYVGTSFTDTEWVKDSNWEKIPKQKQLTELQNNSNKNIALTYGKSMFGFFDLDKDTYYSLAGLIAPENPSSYSNPDEWASLKIQVFEGDSIVLKTKGGSSGRAYALTDLDRKIYEVADENSNFLAEGKTITATKKGYLYCNINGSLSEIQQFELSYSGDELVRKIDNLQSVEKENKNGITSNKQEIEKLKKGSSLYTYTKSDLLADKWWSMGNIGTIMAEEPNVYGSSNQWWCNRYVVKAGYNITLKTKGGSSGRAYALTNDNREIYEVAEASADYTSEAKNITASKDGYLYVNCTTLDAANVFELIIEYNGIELLNIRVDELEQKIAKKTRILSISNSYGCDALGYIPKVLESIGIADYEFAVAYHAAATLQNHVENLGTAYYTFYYTDNGVWKNESNKDLLYILQKHNWDYIVFQQGSAASKDYSTYTPYLEQLMEYVSNNVKNKVQFAFNMTQQYPASDETMLDGIKEAAKQVYENFGINIIPVGIAVQSARGTSLNQYGDGTQLTSDGTHLEDGVGRLLASYTWIKFLLDIDVWDASYCPQYPLDITIPDGPRKSFTNVTEEIAWLAKLSVAKSVRALYKLLVE